jgi:hypothetical protein
MRWLAGKKIGLLTLFAAQVYIADKAFVPV